MKRASEFHNYVVYDLLEHIGGITSRPMFSGYGLYKDGMIFGIIADGALYFKVDEESKEKYAQLGGKPFSYARKDGKVISMSYSEVPEEVTLDRDRMEEYVLRAVAINTKQKSKKH